MENPDQWDTTQVEKEVDDKVHRAWGKQEEDHFGCSSSLAFNDVQK